MVPAAGGKKDKFVSPCVRITRGNLRWRLEICLLSGGGGRGERRGNGLAL